MGLCKCPKRKVTNLFCFEHRVNVCEYCLIDNHPKCVVQSYLNWLKDSDYDPNCPLCCIPLTEGEVVRLLCYDVFHIRCLEKHYRSLPSNTAPAGYRCYVCDSPVFPSQNQAGYVADRLRDVLSKYNWARVGLCLPLIDEPEMTLDDEPSDFIIDRDDDTLHGSTIPSRPYEDDFSVSSSPLVQYNNSRNIESHAPANTWHSAPASTRNDHRPATTLPASTVLSIDQVAYEDPKAVPRKMLSDNLPSSLISIASEDPDGPDKYKRRSAWSWLRRWLKSRMLRGRGFHDSRIVPRRMAVLLLIGLLALLTFIVFATKVGRRPSSDPNFDPMRNPNIHVAQQKLMPPNFDLNNLNDEAEGNDLLQAVKPVVVNGG